VALIQTLGELYPKKIDLLGNRKLIGSLETIRVLDAGEAATKVMDSWMKTLNQFSEKRQQYLLYP